MKVDRLQNTIADVIIFIMAIVIFCCGYNTTSFSYFGTNILTDLVDNWKKRPILDIVKGYGSCPPSYEPLYEDLWPGTVQGCVCSKNNIVKGSCSSKKSSSCKTVPPVGEVDLHHWDGALLCAKKHDKDYLYFSQRNIRMGCGLEDKICGRLDSLGKSYCVGENEECFINKIVINSEISSDAKESNTITLEYGKYLKFYKDELNGENVIVDFKPSIGDVCIDPFEKNINYAPYELLDQSKYKYTCSHKISDTFYDSRFKKIDQCDLNIYYQSNSISPLINSLPGYQPPPSGTNIELFTRGYLGWKDYCIRDQFVSPSNISDSLQKLHTLNFFQFGIYVISILYFFLMGGLLLYKINKVLLNPDDTSAEEYIIIADAINFVGIMIGLVFAILAYSTGSGLVNFFMALRDLECGDHITNQILFSFGNELNTNVNKNFTSLLFYIITMILIPLNLIVMNYRNPYDTNIQMENYVLLPIDEK